MTHKELMIHTLSRKAPVKGSHVPHFELGFFLTMETFNQVHYRHRKFHQWNQMKEAERQLHRLNMADIAINTAKMFEHSAIMIPWFDIYDVDETARMVDIIRKKTNDEYFLVHQGYDGTFAMPDGETMMEVSMKLVDAPQEIKDHHQKVIDRCIDTVKKVNARAKIDGLFLTCDYCFNNGPFLSPDQFAEFTAPQLKYEIDAFRALGSYTIKHTDGNIMPIVEQLVDCGPDAIHSLDPQGGVDIKLIKEKYGKQVALMGNVNCGLMDSGTDEETIKSAEYCMTHGKTGGGYIFSTSNCVYTGMELRKYQLILEVWKKMREY